MPKPYPLRLVLRILKNNGFVFVSQKGSHAKYHKDGNPALIVIVPIHGKEITYGTLRSISRQANLTKEDFEKK